LTRKCMQAAPRPSLATAPSKPEPAAPAAAAAAPAAAATAAAAPAAAAGDKVPLTDVVRDVVAELRGDRGLAARLLGKAA
jgi:hypothetical protein